MKQSLGSPLEDAASAVYHRTEEEGVTVSQICIVAIMVS